MKVGIITHYYGNLNYGGTLQAYALTRFLLKNDVDAEQICFNYFAGVSCKEEKTKRSFFKRLFNLLKNGPKGILKKIAVYNDIKNNLIGKKEVAFNSFREKKVAHGHIVYDCKTLSDTNNIYDVFIVGSDQVWNLMWYRPEWFLSFVPPSKKKMSYAASMAMDALTNEQQEMVKKHLLDYYAISVRERQSVGLLKGIAPIEPQYVVDPVLLLNREDWDEICSERVIKGKYLFCYFLGDGKMERVLAKKTARVHGLKLVHIAHKPGKDFVFGDVRLQGISPQQFVSLIKHAEYVFTDSFHAVVFSFIYQKQYFVFNRDEKGTMNSRITDITELFDTTERFCQVEEKETIRYINSLSDIDYTKPNNKLKELREKSIEFLLNNLKD